MPELVVQKFRRRMRRLMLGAGFVTVLATPSLCAVLVVSAAERQAQTYAHHVAALVHELAADRPALWQYDSARIVHHLRAYRSYEDIASISLRDRVGRIIESGAATREVTVAEATAPVWVDGERVGTVTISMAPAPLARVIGLVAAAAAVVGGLLALFGYRIPVRELASAAGRLDRANGALLDARAAAAATAADEAARRQIATDLHDGLGQTLVALRFATDRLEREHDVPEGATAPARRLIDGAIAEVRRAVRALRPALLDDLGLAAALSALGCEIQEATGLVVEVAAREQAAARLDPSSATILYRAAQELLTNVQRHASARRVGIVLEDRGDVVELVVHDDGRGMPSEVRPGGGLGGLRERLGSVGGSMTIERPERGARVVVRVPRSGPEGGP
ncbi:MAG: hypothetical protein IT379_24105 [Deltaproteobacteria bacterium]|nr:hypothetical protein [Deltaproteobacteria bacterium]